MASLLQACCCSPTVCGIHFTDFTYSSFVLTVPSDLTFANTNAYCIADGITPDAGGADTPTFIVTAVSGVYQREFAANDRLGYFAVERLLS